MGERPMTGNRVFGSALAGAAARLRRARRQDDGSMILTLVMLVFGVLLLMTLGTYVVSEQAKTQTGRSLTNANHAAQDGIQRAVFSLNAGVTPSTNPAAPTTGADQDGATYSYYLTATAGTAPGTSYTVTSIGSSTIGAHTTTFRMTALLSGTTDPQAGAWTDAVFGDQWVAIGQGTVGAYTPGGGANPLANGTGYIGTNGNVSLDTTTTVDGYELYGTTSNPDPSRCSTYQGACHQAAVGKFHQYADLDNSAQVASYTRSGPASCQQAQTSWPTWTTSTSATKTLPAGIACYSSVTFDQNTTVGGTTSNPTVLVVAGPVTVGSGVSVNAPGAWPQSANLVVLVTGSTGSVTDTAGTIAADIDAPAAPCTLTGAATAATVYGGLICRTVYASGTGPVDIYKDVTAMRSPASSGDAVVWTIAQESNP